MYFPTPLKSANDMMGSHQGQLLSFAPLSCIALSVNHLLQRYTSLPHMLLDVLLDLDESFEIVVNNFTSFPEWLVFRLEFPTFRTLLCGFII